MKKIKLLVITGISIGLLSMVAVKSENAEVNSLFGIENADADCVSTAINNGKCSFSGTCFSNPGGVTDCDTTKGGPTTPPPGGGN